MNRKYSGFTLIEMLIVMGIIIILMIVGITAARFAINRANDVAHRNAVDQVVTSLQAYYTDERQYPTNECGASGNTQCTVESLVGHKLVENAEDGYLVPYIDKGAFDGGSKATYFYMTGGDGGNQSFLVCVTLRGSKEEMAASTTRTDLKIYCNGPGIGDDSIHGGNITTKELEKDSDGYNAVMGATGVTWDKGWQ